MGFCGFCDEGAKIGAALFAPNTMDDGVDCSIIIVSYNTRDLTVQCLHSVYRACKHLRVEVIVVDNASADDSLKEIRRLFPEVVLLSNPENRGYSRANNQGLDVAKGRTLILLNSDTVLSEDALIQIISGFDSDTHPGVIGPRLINGDGSVQPSFGKFSSLMIEFLFQTFLFKILPVEYVLGDQVKPAQYSLYNRPHRVDWITGACFALRKDVLEQVGRLSEDLFMYGEDMDWCKRIHDKGYPIVYWPQSRVTHLSRQSSRSNYQRWIQNYTYGTLRFAQRYRGPVQLRLYGMVIGLGSVLRAGLWFGVGLAHPERKTESAQRIRGYRTALRMGFTAFWKGFIDASIVP